MSWLKKLFGGGKADQPEEAPVAEAPTGESASAEEAPTAEGGEEAAPQDGEQKPM